LRAFGEQLVSTLPMLHAGCLVEDVVDWRSVSVTWPVASAWADQVGDESMSELSEEEVRLLSEARTKR